MNWCWNHLTLCIKASQSYLHRTTLRMCFCFVQFLPLTMAKSMNWRAYFSLLSFNFMIVNCCLKSSQFKMRCENYSHWICFASLVHNTQIKKTNTLGMLTACQCNDVFSIAQIMSDCLTTANLWLFWVYGCLLLRLLIARLSHTVCVFEYGTMYVWVYALRFYYIHKHQQYGSLPYRGCVWISADLPSMRTFYSNMFMFLSQWEQHVQRISYILWSYASPHSLIHTFTHTHSASLTLLHCPQCNARFY